MKEGGERHSNQLMWRDRKREGAAEAEGKIRSERFQQMGEETSRGRKTSSWGRLEASNIGGEQ